MASPLAKNCMICNDSYYMSCSCRVEKRRRVVGEIEAQIARVERETGQRPASVWLETKEFNIFLSVLSEHLNSRMKQDPTFQPSETDVQFMGIPVKELRVVKWV
jgi:hypothetical protein